MIITQNEGLNLNSPAVQQMVKNWPKEKLRSTKFYYGEKPKIERDDGMNQLNRETMYSSPFEMTMSTMIPTIDFSGTRYQQSQAANPGYFDSNQPTYGFNKVGGNPNFINPQFNSLGTNYGMSNPFMQQQQQPAYGYQQNPYQYQPQPQPQQQELKKSDSILVADGPYESDLLNRFMKTNNDRYKIKKVVYDKNDQELKKIDGLILPKEIEAYGAPQPPVIYDTAYQLPTSIPVPGNPNHEAYQGAGYIADDISSNIPFMLSPPPRDFARIPANDGLFYSNVAYMQYPGVNDDPMSGVPSRECLESYNRNMGVQQNRFSNYENPYMPNGATFANNYNNLDPYFRAAHNRAIELGFRSLQEYEAVNIETDKTLFVIACRGVGMTDDEIKEKLKKRYVSYEEQIRMSVEDRTRAITKEIEDRKQWVKDNSIKVNFSIRINGERVSYKPKKNIAMNDPRAFDEFKARCEQQHEERMRLFEYLYENAIERKYDNVGIVDYFNKCLPEKIITEMEMEAKRIRDRNIYNLYNDAKVVRAYRAKFGRLGERRRLHEEDVRLRKNEPPSFEGFVRSNLYGFIPAINQYNRTEFVFVPVEKDLNQNIGSCFQCAMNSNGEACFINQNIMSDEEFNKTRNKFLDAVDEKGMTIYSEKGKRYKPVSRLPSFMEGWEKPDERKNE